MMHRAWACTYATGPTTLMHSRACKYGAACKYAAQGLQICCIRPANMMHRACANVSHTVNASHEYNTGAATCKYAAT